MTAPPEPASSTTVATIIGSEAERNAKRDIGYWTESKDAVALQILKRALTPPAPVPFENLEAIGLLKLPRRNEAELQVALGSPGTTCLVGASGMGKSFLISSITRDARRAALRAQEQAGPVDRIGSIPEVVSCLDATQAPLCLHISMRGMPDDVDALGGFILRQLGASDELAEGQSIYSLCMEWPHVLQVLHARTGHLPFFVIDDAHHIFELDAKNKARRAMEVFIMQLHEVTYLHQSVRLFLIMDCDQTEALRKLSGMNERLELIRAGYVDVNEHSQTLQDKLGLSASEVETIISTTGGNFVDLDKVLRHRATKGIPAALADLVKASADQMIDFISNDPAPPMAWQFLQHLCTHGRVDMAGATAQLGVHPVDPKHVIKRLTVANLALKQDTNIYFPYKPAQRKAWAQVEGNAGVRERVGAVAPLAPCLKNY